MGMKGNDDLLCGSCFFWSCVDILNDTNRIPLSGLDRNPGYNFSGLL